MANRPRCGNDITSKAALETGDPSESMELGIEDRIGVGWEGHVCQRGAPFALIRNVECSPRS